MPAIEHDARYSNEPDFIRSRGMLGIALGLLAIAITFLPAMVM